MTETDPAPAVSAEGKDLLSDFAHAHWRLGFYEDGMGEMPDEIPEKVHAAREALSAYIAGLEARNAELLRQRENAWAAWQAESDRHAETCAELYALAEINLTKDTTHA